MQRESPINTATRWIASTQRRFSQPPKVLIYRSGQTEQKPSPNSRVFWVLSRRSTRQTVFTFPAELPDAKRKALIGLQVRRWAPWPNVKFSAYWAANRATVYAWNDDDVKTAIAEAGLSARRCIVTPESFVRRPLQDGVRLVTALDGFEGQVWQNGFIAFSRWWPRQPGQSEWDMFVRSAGLPLDQFAGQVPTPQDVPFLESPWTHQQNYLAGAWAMLEDPRYAAVAAAVVAAPFVYLAVQYATLAVSNARVNSQIEQITLETQGVRKQRSQALANLDEIDDFLSLEVYPTQFEILTTSLSLLQPMNAKIAEWTYDVGTLSFTLRPTQELEPTFLITAFEKIGLFSNVTATRSGQEGLIRVRMDVQPRAPKRA